MITKTEITAATLAAAFALLAGPASAQQMGGEKPGMEKCYGVALKGHNDCAAVRRLPPGAQTFMQSLAARNPLGEAAAAALAANASFDLAANLAALFAGLAIETTNEPFEVPLP